MLQYSSTGRRRSGVGGRIPAGDVQFLCGPLFLYQKCPDRQSARGQPRLQSQSGSDPVWSQHCHLFLLPEGQGSAGFKIFPNDPLPSTPGWSGWSSPLCWCPSLHPLAHLHSLEVRGGERVDHVRRSRLLHGQRLHHRYQHVLRTSASSSGNSQPHRDVMCYNIIVIIYVRIERFG